VSVAQRKSSGGVTSLHECHFSPTYPASPAGELSNAGAHHQPPRLCSAADRRHSVRFAQELFSTFGKSLLSGSRFPGSYSPIG
jgi:hypothetical protein